MMEYKLGATPLPGGGCHFEVWAPKAQRVDLVVRGFPSKRRRMERRDDGIHVLDVRKAGPGTRYDFRLDGGERRADPASRFQPKGIPGPSEVVDLSKHEWHDKRWKGHARNELVIYELHVGTYTQKGTFDALIEHLDGLTKLGVTAIELMPVAQFPGERNWGYDGVFLNAPQNSYGGPEGLQRLVDAAHKAGLSVLLDVVYNHVGPEGNYLAEFAPYFNPRRPTPWGDSVNVDGRGSDHVRRFFIENALLWLEDYHMDGLRLDAVHAIVDMSAKTFMEELAEACDAAAVRRGFSFHIIAESSANDPRYVRPRGQHGWGLHAAWNDDFSHSLYTFTTHDRTDYAGDYPDTEALAKAFRNAYTLDGDYSKYRGRRHGRPPVGLRGDQFVVCADNHDQVGNRAEGERLSRLVSFEMLKVSAAAVALSPFIPLFFMGEEYAEPAPFLYFTDHRGKELREAVTKGRKEEFRAHGWKVEPPDHAARATFERSKLDHELKRHGKHAAMLGYYRELLRLRRSDPVLRELDHTKLEARTANDGAVLFVQRANERKRVLLVLHNGHKPATLAEPWPDGSWELVLDSSEKRWGGPGRDHATKIHAKNRTGLEIGPECALVYESRNPG